MSTQLKGEVFQTADQFLRINGFVHKAYLQVDYNEHENIYERLSDALQIKIFHNEQSWSPDPEVWSWTYRTSTSSNFDSPDWAYPEVIHAKNENEDDETYLSIKDIEDFVDR